jgi:hypothetical protein
MKKLLLSLMIVCFICLHSTLFSQKIEQDKELKNKTITLKLANTPVNILIYERGSENKIIYFNMHDNENTSVAVSKKMIDNLGKGKFAELRHNGNRLISFYLKGIKYSIDPNRIFTPKGIEKTLRWYGSYSKEAQIEVEKFSASIIKEVLKDSDFVVAMHNNSNLKTFSIHDFHPKTGKFGKEAKEIYCNPKMSAGDFFYTIQESHFNYFKNNQMNVVLQNNTTFSDDGSLSTYCTQKNIPYINVEAKEGHFEAQLEMLVLLQNLFTSLKN